MAKKTEGMVTAVGGTQLLLKCTIKGVEPGLLMHKFPLKTITKNMNQEEQAEAVAHRMENGNLALPGYNDAMFKVILGASGAFKIGKKGAYGYVAAGLQVREKMIDLGIRDYAVFSHHTRIPPKKGAIVMTHRPLIENWQATFHIMVDLRVWNFLAPKEIAAFIRQIVERAGLFVGLLDWSPRLCGPYGKFDIVEFEIV